MKVRITSHVGQQDTDDKFSRWGFWGTIAAVFLFLPHSQAPAIAFCFIFSTLALCFWVIRYLIAKRRGL